MSKKLTLNDMKNIAPLDPSLTIVQFDSVNGENVNIEFDTNLSITEMSNFVDTVADGVFTYLDDYIPEYRDLWTFVALIKISNMPLPKKKNKEEESVVDYKIAYAWMQKLDIVNRLRDQDESFCKLLPLFNNLDRMITDKIEFKKKEILAFPKAEFQNICSTVNNFIGSLSELSEKLKNVDLNKVAEDTSKIANKDEKELANAIIDIQTRKEVDVENKDTITEE